MTLSNAMDVNGALTLNGGAGTEKLMGSTANVAGDLNVTSFAGGDTNITLDAGSGTQTINGTNGASLPTLTINSSSTVVLNGTVEVAKDFTRPVRH